MSAKATDPAWYVAYGSNLAAARFACYISGGCPEGGRRTYTGCRDTTAVRAHRPVELPGEVVFAGSSRVWSGGMAFYREDGSATVAARAYLLTMAQVNDVVAQETRLPPGTDLRLAELPEASAAKVRDGGYDTVVRLHDIDGLPAVTITSTRSLEPAPPSAAYLRWVCAGLRETYGWTAEQVADYLAGCPGVRGRWPRDALVDQASGWATS